MRWSQVARWLQHVLVVGVLLPTGCRQALGIPEHGTVEEFSLGGEMRGAVGITNGPARLFVDGDELAVAADGPFTFGRLRADGSAYDVTAEHCNVTNGAGTIAGADVTNIALVCDGLVSLRSFGFSAPLEVSGGFAPGTLDHEVVGSVLSQQLVIAPAVSYDGARVVDVQVDTGVLSPNADGSYGPIAIGGGEFVQITVDNPTAPEFRTRTYTASIEERAPAAYGYGKADAPTDGDRLGSALAAHGDLLVAGLPERPGGGAALVFRRSGQAWTQEAVLTAPEAADRFGASVAVSANRIVVGAPGTTGAGAVYEFSTAGAYVTTHRAPAPAAGDAFGAAVALAGDRLAVGAPGTASERGAAYLIDGSGTRALVAATDPGDRFGAAIAVGAARVVVGAPGDDSSDGTGDNRYADAGAAYVFDGATTTYLKASVPGAGDAFGAAVAIDDVAGVVAVGAPLDDSSVAGIDGASDDAANASGAVYTFGLAGTAWDGQHVVKAPVVGVGDNFGATIAIAGSVLAIGAPYRNAGALDAGTVYAYSLASAPSTATMPELLTASNAGDNDAFGAALALTLETLVVGAPCEDSRATGWNHTNQGDGAIDTGAIYTFR